MNKLEGLLICKNNENITGVKNIRLENPLYQIKSYEELMKPFSSSAGSKNHETELLMVANSR